MSFASRLKEQRERIGLTQIDLANTLGITKGAIGNYETGASSPKAEILYQLFDILHCDANYLFQDEMNALHATHATPDEMDNLVKKYRTLDEYGKQAVTSVLNIEHKRCNEIQSKTLTEIIEIPFPIQSASAGTGELADDETVEHIPVLRNVWTSKADYTLRVHGDSMEPEIYDGDMLLVRSQPAVEIGETGIFIREGERYVKIYRGDYLESLNPTYENVPLEEYSKCIGKVIGVLKPEWIVK